MTTFGEVANYRPEYVRRAAGACKAEREGRWGDALSLWSKAAQGVCSNKNRQYAEIRQAFCANAVARGWRSPHAR